MALSEVNIGVVAEKGTCCAARRIADELKRPAGVPIELVSVMSMYLSS